MKRLLILGDSHAAGLRRAGRSRSWPADLSFFVHPSHVDAHLGKLECMDDRLEMATVDGRFISSTGNQFFRPDEYDAVALVGLRTELPYSLWNGWDSDPVPRGGKAVLHISSAVQHAALTDYVREQALSYNVAVKIRSVSDCRLIVIPNPYVNLALRRKPIPTAPGIVPSGLVQADQINFEEEKLDEWKAILINIFGPLAVEVLFQPELTTAEHIFTKPEYCAGDASAPLMRHMNDPFGEIILNQLMDCVGVKRA